MSGIWWSHLDSLSVGTWNNPPKSFVKREAEHQQPDRSRRRKGEFSLISTGVEQAMTCDHGRERSSSFCGKLAILDKIVSSDRPLPLPGLE